MRERPLRLRRGRYLGKDAPGAVLSGRGGVSHNLPIRVDVTDGSELPERALDPLAVTDGLDRQLTADLPTCPVETGVLWF
jgi:hypothetical protein